MTTATDSNVARSTGSVPTSHYSEAELGREARRMARGYGRKARSWAVVVSNSGARLLVRLGDQLKRGKPRGHTVASVGDLAHGITLAL